MRVIPTCQPTSVAAIDEDDPKAGGAAHRYAIQFGGPENVCVIQFQHGPRGLPTSTPGVFEDDLLAILEDRLKSFQEGPFACEENEAALIGVLHARAALGGRVVARLAKGVLGINEKH